MLHAQDDRKKQAFRKGLYLGAALLLAALVGAYWYASPYLAVRQLQSAALAADAEAFNDHVDYPRLRDSLKGQIAVLMADQMAQGDAKDNPFAALGNMLGMALANQMVDAMVRPEMVMRAMSTGKLLRPKEAETPAGSPVPPASDAPADRKSIQWVIDRRGANKIAAYAVDPESPQQTNAERFGLGFERSGFASWKLVSVQLPARAP